MVAVRQVIVKGTTEQIALAKSLIEEQVLEGNVAREKIQESLDKRSPRKRMGPQYLMPAEALEVCLTMLKHQRTCRKLFSVMMHCMVFHIHLKGLKVIQGAIWYRY